MAVNHSPPNRACDFHRTRLSAKSYLLVYARSIVFSGMDLHMTFSTQLFPTLSFLDPLQCTIVSFKGASVVHLYVFECTAYNATHTQSVFGTQSPFEYFERFCRSLSLTEVSYFGQGFSKREFYSFFHLKCFSSFPKNFCPRSESLFVTDSAST